MVTVKKITPVNKWNTFPETKRLLLITGRKLAKQRKTVKSCFNLWYSANCSCKSVIYLLRVLITRFIAVLHS